jgi:hypothetical protein
MRVSSAVVRAALVGFGSGARSLSAITACALTTPGPGRVDGVLHRPRVRKSLRSSALLELVSDKLPVTPPRTSPPSLTSRIALGALSAGVLASRAGDRRRHAVVVGAATAAGWALAGGRYRAVLTRRFGSDLPGAAFEDGATILAGVIATRIR